MTTQPKPLTLNRWQNVPPNQIWTEYLNGMAGRLREALGRSSQPNTARRVVSASAYAGQDNDTRLGEEV